MANYSVDDILAEVNSKKKKHTEEAEASYQKKASSNAGGNAPFKLSGMTEDFNPPVEKRKAQEKPSGRERADYYEKVREERPVRSRRGENEPYKPYFDESDESFTITVGLKKKENGQRVPDEDSKTTVMPAVKELNRKLRDERQEKIREFMEKSSFDEDDDEDYGDGFDFGQEEKEEFKSALGLKKKSSSGKKKEKTEKKERSRRTKERPEREDTREEAETEFNSVRDISDISEEIAARKKTCLIKTAVTGVIFLILFYLSLCNLYPLPLLSPICPENNMRAFILINLFLLLCASMVKASDIGGGLRAFLTLKSDNDTPAALATVTVIIHGAFLAFKDSYIFTGEAHIFFAVAALILFMNSFGKLLVNMRVEKNFAVASCGKDLDGEYVIESENLAAQLSEGQGFDEPSVSYNKKVAFPSDFMSLSYTDDSFESNVKIISPLFLVFGIIISAVSFLFFDYTGSEALTVFTVVMCMASPLTATLVSALPLLRSALKLSSKESFISGYESVCTFEDVNGILINSNELYKAEDVVLHGIKAFGDMRVDNSIVEAASLQMATDGLLKEVFMDVIERKLSMLRKVTDVKSYNGGIGGNVDGVKVLMGSRELMEKFSVSLPSEDYERKFLKDDRRIIYMSSDGILSAMIVVSYYGNEDAAHYLKKLNKYAPALIVRTDDPNIDTQKINSDYGYPEEYINIVTQDNYDSVDALRRSSDRGRALAMTTGETSRLRLIFALVNLKKTISTATVFQMAGLILGYALVVFMTFTGKIHLLGFLQIIIYQLFWGICIMAVSSLGEY